MSFDFPNIFRIFFADAYEKTIQSITPQICPSNPLKDKLSSSLEGAGNIEKGTQDQYWPLHSLPKNFAQLNPSSRSVTLRANLPATRLDLFVERRLAKSYRIAIGKLENQTPVRGFSLSEITWNPWWVPPSDSEWAKNAEIMPPGPDNPMGPVKMSLGNEIFIHATNAPRSIGHAITHSCLRMNSQDAVELAWEIQKRCSHKRSLHLLIGYSKDKGKTSSVKCSQPIPVTIDYKQVEISGQTLLIHPDLYNKSGFEEELKIALADHPEIQIDSPTLETLDQLRRQGTISISLTEVALLQSWFYRLLVSIRKMCIRRDSERGVETSSQNPTSFSSHE
jgi:Uncharacterized protein conserved in bacteria